MGAAWQQLIVNKVTLEKVKINLLFFMGYE